MMDRADARRRFTRVLSFLGLAVAAVVPLAAIAVAVETDTPALGAVGLVLLAVLAVLVGRY
jgi:hypothetical protein